LFLLAGQFPGSTAAQSLRHALGYALAAERAGLDGVWIAEHHFLTYGVCPSALAFAGYLAGATSRLRVGTAACILPNRHPVALAEEAVLIDELSGGRLDLGVARGGPWVDLEVFGTGLPRYTEGFTESLDLMLRWLSGAAAVQGDGPQLRFRRVPVIHRPRRPPPVWVAATSPPTAQAAAARGLPLLLGMHAAPQDRLALLEAYAAAAAEHGHDPASVAHAAAHLCHLDDSEQQGRAALRQAMPGWLAGTRDYVRIDGTAGAGRDPHEYLEDLLRIHPIGPPDLCARRLAETSRATGVRHLLLMVEGTGDPQRTHRTILGIGTDLLPALRAASGPPPAAHPTAADPMRCQGR
jgi:alkanesulfonate monooxygenase SsuD/methylene tetrahydromethanopterin reductase-like flavin-dependent oxidoreductase (luciferase family)